MARRRSQDDEEDLNGIDAHYAAIANQMADAQNNNRQNPADSRGSYARIRGRRRR